MSRSQFVLGADFSTDSVKGVVVDTTNRTVVESVSFNLMEVFGQQYQLKNGGFIIKDDGRVRIPCLLIADGLDELLRLVAAKMGDQKANITAICVSFQQHGMVSLRDNPNEMLKFAGSDPLNLMSHRLGQLFSARNATSWMDRKTEQVCKQLTERMPAAEWAECTGSVPMQSLRFLCPQAALMFQKNQTLYYQTRQFTVLASLGTALLTGKVPGIGIDEASMTLGMDLEWGEWSQIALDHFPQGLPERLPNIVSAGSFAGTIWDYWVKRYGFSAGTNVYLGFGDNIAANITANNVISLGSSGTVHRRMDTAIIDPTGASHVLHDGTGKFMGMFVTDKCGKFADSVREGFGLTWPEFDANVKEPKWDPGQMVFMTNEETLIRHRVGSNDIAAAVTRSILYNMHRTCAFMGNDFPHLVATGGFAKGGVLQMIADIWQKPVYAIEEMERVAVGSAAWAAAQVTRRPLQEFVDALCPLGGKVEPDPNRAEFYTAFGEIFNKVFPLVT